MNHMHPRMGTSKLPSSCLFGSRGAYMHSYKQKNDVCFLFRKLQHTTLPSGPNKKLHSNRWLLSYSDGTSQWPPMTTCTVITCYLFSPAAVAAAAVAVGTVGGLLLQWTCHPPETTYPQSVCQNTSLTWSSLHLLM
jgi:hypothetical protein